MPAEVSADEPEESLIVRAVISGEISQRGLIGLESGVELLGRVEMGRGAPPPPPPPCAHSPLGGSDPPRLRKARAMRSSAESASDAISSSEMMTKLSLGGSGKGSGKGSWE